MAPTLISLVGRQGAGKSTIAGGLAEVIRCGHVETSDVVKSIYAGLPRGALPFTGQRTKTEPDWLAKELHKNLLDRIDLWDKEVAVLSGAREQNLHDYLTKHFDLYTFEVVCDAELRYQRLYVLRKIKNGKEFIEHEIKETELGVQETMDKAPFRIPSTEETQPEYIVKAMLKALHQKGASL